MLGLHAIEPTSLPVPATKLYLPSGLVGLNDLKQFELVTDEESLPFRRLRSLDTEEIEFVVVNPEGLIPNYTAQIPDEDAEILGINAAENSPEILNILTIHSMQPQRVTANLVAPIIVNPSTGVARQVILGNYKDYSTHYPLINEA